MDDLDYILGRQLAEQIRQSPVISDQVISSLIKDMLGADLSLLVPLRDLMSQPSLEQAIRLGVHENPSLLRDSLLTALSSTYQPEIICRLHNVLNGSLNLQAEQGKIQTVDLRNAASITAAPSESLSASYYQQPQPHIGPITTKNRNPLPRSSILLFSFLVGGLLTGLIVLITMVAQMQQQKTAESPSTNVRPREEPTTVEPKLSPLGTNYVPDPDESLANLTRDTSSETSLKALDQDSSTFYDAGTAFGGQPVRLDLTSIKSTNVPGKVLFHYYLGSERVASEANCSSNTWTTYPEGVTHSPKSIATSNMLKRVCQGISNPGPSISSSGAAIVFDPPSNIRVTPNGVILCSVTGRGSIPIQGKYGDWFKTDYCGSPGYIHKGQVKF